MTPRKLTVAQPRLTGPVSKQLLLSGPRTINRRRIALWTAIIVAIFLLVFSWKRRLEVAPPLPAVQSVTTSQLVVGKNYPIMPFVKQGAIAGHRVLPGETIPVILRDGAVRELHIPAQSLVIESSMPLNTLQVTGHWKHGLPVVYWHPAHLLPDHHKRPAVAIRIR